MNFSLRKRGANRSINIVPREPFFKAYLFFEEYEHDRRTGIMYKILSKLYYGIVYQSNWHPKHLKFIKTMHVI